MTRKQALYKALQVLTDKEAIEKINEILDDIPFTDWNERTIFDTIDQFIIDNKRKPTSTDFKKKGLPSHTVIKLRFNMNLKEFLHKYYPFDRLCNSSVYYTKTKDEWKNIFISEYNKIEPKSAEEYNSKRTDGNPSWGTVARLFDIYKWLEWLNFCKLERYCVINVEPRSKKKLRISSNNDLEKELEDF